MRADMQNTNLYLKGNVLFEPLFNQWYAWASLIAPATAALYMANQHMRIMQSFVAAPQVHVSTLKNSAMLGGPFINYDASRVPEIKALIERTAKEQAHMLEFAESIKALDQLLINEGNGDSLEPLYQKIPDALKGFVELVYDLNNHPSIRFVEGLLYHSHYYNASSQSVSLTLADKDERSFVFSTPRLESEGTLVLDKPFCDESLDVLFRMKDVPSSFGDLKERLGIRNDQAALFSTFFTEEPRPAGARYMGDSVRIRYLGHACLLIQSKQTSILCDPAVSYDLVSNIPRYTFSDLPEMIDYVLITHNHQDHCLFETLLQLRHKIQTVVVPKNNGGGVADPSLKQVMRQIGFANVLEIDEMETFKVDGAEITGLPFLGEHADLNIRSKTAYLIRLEDKMIMCAADSCNLEPKTYEHIHRVFGDIDVIFIGMECDGAPMSWLYGPLLTRPLTRKQDQSRRSNGSDYVKAANIVNEFNPRQVYVYAMGQEPWLTYLTSIQYTKESRPIIESDRLVEYCHGRGIVAERLFGLKEIVL